MTCRRALAAMPRATTGSPPPPGGRVTRGHLRAPLQDLNWMTRDCSQVIKLYFLNWPCDDGYGMKAEKQEELLSRLDKYQGLALSSPLLIGAFLIVLYYFGGPDLRRLVNFLTFSN